MLQNIVGFCVLVLAIYAGYWLCAENKRQVEEAPATAPQARFPEFERAASLGLIGFIFSYVALYVVVALIWDMRWAFTACIAPLRLLGL